MTDAELLNDLRKKVALDNLGKVLPDVWHALGRATKAAHDIDTLKTLLAETFAENTHHRIDGVQYPAVVRVHVASTEILLPVVEAAYVRLSQVGERYDPVPVVFELVTWDRGSGAAYAVMVPEPDDRPPLRAKDVMRV